MMDGWHGIFGGGFMWIIWLLIIFAIFYLLANVISGNNGKSVNNEDEVLDILNKRLASGEINEAEYRRLRKNIENK